MAKFQRNSRMIGVCYGLLVAICLMLNPFLAQRIAAQDSLKTNQQVTAVALSEGEWKAVMGVFQNAQNKEMYVEFSAGEGSLLAKLLWNNNEIHLIPQSALAFVSKEAEEGGPIHVTFVKDSSGGVNQVKVANNGIWNRATNYKPVIKKEMPHTPQQLAPFEGLYQLQNANDRFIAFRVKDNNLILKQHWDGDEISFVPETTLDFFSKEVPLFTLTFSKDSYGNVDKFVAFKQDVWIKLKKAQPTLQELKAFEGKYQSKDDPDNVIQLIARGSNLVVKQLWDGKEITVEAQTPTYFYNLSQSYPLQISKDNEGAATQVTILGMDVFKRMK